MTNSPSYSPTSRWGRCTRPGDVRPALKTKGPRTTPDPLRRTFATSSRGAAVRPSASRGRFVEGGDRSFHVTARTGEARDDPGAQEVGTHPCAPVAGHHRWVVRGRTGSVTSYSGPDEGDVRVRSRRSTPVRHPAPDPVSGPARGRPARRTGTATPLACLSCHREPGRMFDLVRGQHAGPWRRRGHTRVEGVSARSQGPGRPQQPNDRGDVGRCQTGERGRREKVGQRRGGPLYQPGGHRERAATTQLKQ